MNPNENSRTAKPHKRAEAGYRLIIYRHIFGVLRPHVICSHGGIT